MLYMPLAILCVLFLVCNAAPQQKHQSTETQNIGQNLEWGMYYYYCLNCLNLA